MAGVYRSTDDGASWIPAETNSGALVVTAFTAIGTTLFAGTASNGVYISTDEGASWMPVNAGLTDLNIYALLSYANEVGDTNLIAGTKGGGAFRSTDHGAGWTQINNGLTETNIWALAASPRLTSGMNLYAGTEGGVYRSTNDGESWTAINEGLTSPDVETFAVAPNGDGGTNLFAVTSSDGGVFLSTDSGEHWSPASTGFPAGTRVRSLAASGANLYAGTDNGVWKRSLSDFVTGIGDPPGERPGGFVLFQNYPNPFNPATVITYQVPVAGVIRIVVFDALGREVATLVDEVKPAAVHSVEFDGKGLASGVYICRMQAGGQVMARKLLLMR
ncbi:MAG: T9SS type A sorting domain-containing protein [Bacteroidetes bacterium]|nr:T9SS type A sorting domain-containing protein [Bacteroidota bacterium]